MGHIFDDNRQDSNFQTCFFVYFSFFKYISGNRRQKPIISFSSHTQILESCLFHGTSLQSFIHLLSHPTGFHRMPTMYWGVIGDEAANMNSA